MAGRHAEGRDVQGRDWFEYCNKLFALERKFETFAPKTRQQARQAQVEPLLDVYWAWVDKLEAEPDSKLGEAVAYARNQKAFLNAFLHHGEVDTSNNIAENAIRPFLVGRKNWLFCDMPKGVEASAVVCTLVETAKANGLDPFRYLNYVLTNIRFWGQNPSNAELEEFLPWRKAIQAECKSKLSGPSLVSTGAGDFFVCGWLLSAYSIRM